jgi:uncharacterized protein YjbJ (UPF0337 family)
MDAVGRAREAAGSLSGDRELKRDSRIDQAGERIRTQVEKIAEMAKELLHNR